MNDNKDEKTTGYTGEYGNSIEGEYVKKEESTYSYSYKTGDGSATHSGDYYANQNNATEGSAQESTAGSSENANTGSNRSEHAQDNGYTSAGYQNFSNAQNTSHENSYSDNNGYGGNYYQNGTNNNHYGKKNKKDRKPLSLGQKIAVTAACAVMFGTVAGVCFNGVNYVANRYLHTSSSKTEMLTKTTDTKKDATNSAGAVGSVENGADVVSIAEQTMPAVVAITSTTKAQDYYDLFGQFYEGKETTGSGTGFIVGQNDNELLIATNNHVIEGAKTISIKCIDGEIYEAVEKGSDSANDLAVIAVKTKDIKPETMEKIKIADLGSSDDAKVGEKVIAIGNALGYGQSVTVGYISAKDREITETTEQGGTAKIKAIQTDAAINPGNSGGALINMQGQVIGINSAKIADSSVEGVGYAIPISVATPIIDELMNREILADSEKGYLGITGTQVTEAASAYNVPFGVYVKEVAKNGAADKAGIKVNDVITMVNKMEVTSMQSLQEKVNSYRKGTEIEVTVQRMENGEYVEKKVTVKLQGIEILDDLTTNQDSQNNGNNSGSEENNNGWNFFK